jgi:hypothetical protein
MSTDRVPKKSSSNPPKPASIGKQPAPFVAPSAEKKAESGPNRPLAETHPVLLDAIEFFLTENTVFESSNAVQLAMEDIEQSRNLNEAFIAAIQHKLLGMDAALRFCLFLAQAPEKINREIDVPEPAFDPADKFSADAAMNVIYDVYNLAVSGIVDTAVTSALGFDESESEDEEDAEEDEPENPQQ